MSAKSPYVTLRMFGKHRLGPATNLVDVVNLPRSVMQETDGRGLQQQIVVVWRTAHEGRQSGGRVADLETEAIGEKPLRRFQIRRSHDHVSKFARVYSFGPF